MGNKASKLPNSEAVALERDTHFQKKELQEWFVPAVNIQSHLNLFVGKGIHEGMPTGSLTKAAFKDMYKQYFPLGNPDAYAGRVFHLFDVDKNGVCERRLSLNKGTEVEKLQWAFTLYDVNGDGYVTRDEMIQVTPREESRQTVWNDGYGWGWKLSLQDFVKGAQNDPTTMEALAVQYLV
ncbi:EF-hand [Rhizoclosmatium globosum]|uniref:EF-hand n=1 Tax=Rhizoclosmatium globosum TaxID=329046 RepID=A0A1Y2C288_9FUNG|nr:EF-hand [Rhizoclosmatium globosum]|eukprot:ORY41076.1 EF-hand [Rhizoclosmatium globosum]